MALAPWPWPRIFAHRCGGTLAPENTLAGLDVAAAWGCGGVEFDVMLSADATPVLIHDETLERTTNGRGAVAATHDAELFALDAGSPFDRRFAGEPVPTLEAAAQHCQALGLAPNVEIKPSAGADVRTGRIVAAQAQALWRDADVPPLLSSFSEAALEAAAELARGLPRGLLVLSIPPDWRERCERVGAVALHAWATALDAELVRAVHGADLRVVAYTENDPRRAAALLDWGVDGLITDRPDAIGGGRRRAGPAAHARRPGLS